MSSAEGDRRYKPVGQHVGPTGREDQDYTDNFVVLARVTESCARGEEVVLLLSTCRNHWLTINAIFADMKMAVGASKLPDALSRAVFEIRRGGWDKAERALEDAGRALSQVDAKVRVWNDRHELLQDFWTQVDAISEPRDRQRIRLFIESQEAITSTDDHDADGGYIAICLDEVDGAALALTELHTLRVKLGAVVIALRAVVTASTPQELTLLDDPISEERGSPSLLALVETLGNPEWRDDADGKSPGAILGIKVAGDEAGAPETSGMLIGDVVKRCSEVIERAQDSLGEKFRPNISRPPMPAPYLIDVTRMRPPATGRVRHFKVVPHRGHVSPAPESARIALLRCGVPNASYSKDTDRYLRDARNDVSRVTDIATAALEVAKDGGADFLVMPECFLPEVVVSDVVESASVAGIGLIAGVEHELYSAVNKVVVEIPGVAGPVYQRKQAPSKYEVQMESDGIIRKFVDTKLGVMCVVVCSDVLELDLLWALASTEPRVDTIVVCSRNPNPDVISATAAADALRLHAHVVVVNSCAPETGTASASGLGTGVFAPKRITPELELDASTPLSVDGWDEIEPPDVAFWEIPVAGLALRDTHDTMRGYTPAPRFARRPVVEADAAHQNGRTAVLS